MTSASFTLLGALLEIISQLVFCSVPLSLKLSKQVELDKQGLTAVRSQTLISELVEQSHYLLRQTIKIARKLSIFLERWCLNLSKCGTHLF